METGIAALVCYAGVFEDVIGIEEMATRLGVSGSDAFYSALNQMHHAGKIVLRDGFASLPCLGDKISLKHAKIETSGKLIASRLNDLRRLGSRSIINFVGISGSLAANNPARDRDGMIDIDVFLITRNQCIWLYEIPKRIRLNLFPPKEAEPSLCINYVMDESDLRVENRNFYTATEIRNIIPVSGMAAYRKFLRANSWVDYFYPGFSGANGTSEPPATLNLVNKSLYVIVTLMYCLKYVSLAQLRRLSFKSAPTCGTTYNRVSSRRGGYQVFIQGKFSRLVAAWFPNLIKQHLIEKLFPDELSSEIRRGTQEFLKADPNPALGFDYTKYGFQQILPKGG